MHTSQQEQSCPLCTEAAAVPLHETDGARKKVSMRIPLFFALSCLVPCSAMVTNTLPMSSSSLPATVAPPRPGSSWTDSVLLDDDEDEEDEYDEAFFSNFMNLQRSTGSDIPSQDLQDEIDQASTSPDLFLDAHMQDASFMEKVAMSSIPQQLPRPAVAALSKKTRGNLDFSTGRVTPEQEVELAKLIQKGVELHKSKLELESELGREVSRQEWCDYVGISAKELRRQVSDYRRAKQLLVKCNMGLVHAVVKSQRRPQGVSYEELVQEGSLGLLRAAELFDPSRGIRFSTYATIWIKGILSQSSHVVETITLPQREKTKWNKIRKAQADLEQLLARPATPTEICESLGITMEEFVTTRRKMTTAQQVLSLDYEYKTQSRSGTLGDSMASLQNDKAFMADVDLAERAQLKADVVAALARNLTAREARLMRLRYGLTDGKQRSLRECAQAMGLGETRVQQIAQKCLEKLRQAAEVSSLEEYLLSIA